MADFRKCLLVFAVLVLLSGLASAQVTAALQCTFNAAVTPTVRVEGLTELLGDIVLNCNGGTPTPAGLPVPQANITVFLSNANITSRLTGDPFTEVLMIIDEPHTIANTANSLLPCDPGGLTLGICSIAGTGTGIGTYSPGLCTTTAGVTTCANSARPNVFQARLTGVNQVTFFGVPIDPPGTSGTRIIRITNLRGNANMAGASTGSLVPQTITAFISVNPPNLLPLNNPQQTVAFVRPGLTSFAVKSAVSFVQCISQNKDIAGDPSKPLTDGPQFLARFDEGFPSAWKEKNIQTHLSNAGMLSGTLTPAYPADAAQDTPGANYFSESGFEVNGVAPVGTYPLGYGPFALPPNPAFPATRGLSAAGTADAGTRLFLNFSSVPNGTSIFVPTRLYLTIPAASGLVSGFAVLTSTNIAGGGGYSPVSGGAAWPSGANIPPGTTTAPVSITAGIGMAVYEILYTDPFNNERLDVPIAVAYVANAGNNLPQPGLESQVGGGYAPVSSVGTSSASAPIPRFAPNQNPQNDFIINKCSCNLLFPFVTNQQGFDTGIAIANTSLDPFGTTPQAGIVTLQYYSLGTPPPNQVTDLVAAGDEVLFTISGGGNHMIKGTPGFQGYLIATAQFQYCHAYAYISAQGASPQLSAGASYLGIVLDVPGLNRTGQAGEVQAH